MNVISKNPLHITNDDGTDLVTEPTPGGFRFSTPRGYQDAGFLHRMVASIAEERLEACVEEPEKALAHWSRAFSGHRRQS